MELFLASFLFLSLLTVSMAAWSFAPWVPTRKRELKRMLDLAGLREGETFVDLGSGEGRAVFMAAERGAKARGVELALPLHLTAKALSLFRKGETKFVLGDLFRHSVADADVVFLYGMANTSLWDRLRPKLERELRPGARVLSMVFRIDGWEPDAVDRPEGQLPIYLYRR